MSYIDKAAYIGIYGSADSAMDDPTFNRLCWDACRKLDTATTGVDGWKKLRRSPPADADDLEAVKRCACQLVHLMWQMETAERIANQGRGYTETANGLQGKVVSSVSAGNESISYVTGSTGAATLIDKALADKSVRDKLFADTITEYLSGIKDANGVNLLYMGPYPC